MTYRKTSAAIAIAAALTATCSAQAATTYEATVLGDNPISFHRLGESSGATAFDSSPFHRNGVYSPGAVLGVAGPFTQAGTGVSLPAGETMTAAVPATSGTVELWLNMPRVKRGAQAAIVTHGDPAGDGWSLGIGQKRRLTFVSGGQVTQLRANVPSNVWSLIDVAWTGTKVRLYINGSASKERSRGNSTIASSSGALVLGGNGAGAFSGSFAGKLDEVALYPTALTDAQVQAHVAAANLPENLTLPTISGSFVSGQTLTAVSGTWTNATTGSSWQWQSCDEVGDDCDDIPGSTGPTYFAGGVDVGTTLRVVELRSNASGTTAAQSDPTPVITGDPTIPGGGGGSGSGTGTGTGTGTGGTPVSTDGRIGTAVSTTVANTGVVGTGGASCVRLSAKRSRTLRRVGVLRLTFAKSGCLKSVAVAFKAKRGVKVSKVAFRLDGRKVATVRRTHATLKATRLRAGRHTLVVKVTPSHGAARTLRMRLVSAAG